MNTVTIYPTESLANAALRAYLATHDASGYVTHAISSSGFTVHVTLRSVYLSFCL